MSLRSRSGRLRGSAVAAILGGALLIAAAPGLAPIAIGADASPAPSEAPVADPCASPEPDASAAPDASPGPDASPVPEASASAAPSASPAGSPAASPVASAEPAASPEPSAAPEEPCPTPPLASILDLGKDGRLTVLVLGTDYRPTLGGERTDVMIMMSLDPVKHRMVAASIPRDTSFFPRDRANGGATSGGLRVNGLYDYYRKDSLAHKKVDKGAIKKFVKDVEVALGVEIDYYMMTRFEGFDSLIKAMGGVRVDIPQTINDDFIGHGGALFPEGDNYKLGGIKDCTNKKPCHNALLYARSRHGTVGSGYNSDFERSRRQQHLIVDAMNTAIKADWSDEHIADLLKVVKHVTWTDLPLTVEAAREAMRLSEGVTLKDYDSAVFGPSRWAFEDSSTPLYSFRLKVDDVRKWVDDRLGTAGDAGGKGKGKNKN
ncbi:MAG: LCP family protein [Chloroflexota bacterium]